MRGGAGFRETENDTEVPRPEVNIVDVLSRRVNKTAVTGTPPSAFPLHRDDTADWIFLVRPFLFWIPGSQSVVLELVISASS